MVKEPEAPKYNVPRNTRRRNPKSDRPRRDSRTRATAVENKKEEVAE